MPILLLGLGQQAVEFALLVVVQDLVDAGLSGSQNVLIVAREIVQNSFELFGLFGSEIEFFLETMNRDVLAWIGPECRPVQSIVRPKIHGKGTHDRAHQKHQHDRDDESSFRILHRARIGRRVRSHCLRLVA